MLYVLVIISGHEPPSDISLTKATTNAPAQLSASSVTTFGFGIETSSMQSKESGAGLEAVGGITSPTTILWVTRISLPQASVTLYVLVIVSGHEPPSVTSLTKATVIAPGQLS